MTELLLSGRGLLESIRWHDDHLYVSDWSSGEILDVTANETLVATRSFPLCFDWLPDNGMVIVQSTEGKLLHRAPDGTLTTAAVLGDGTWNDITVDPDGDVYVNGPGGTIHRVRGSTTTQVADDLAFPNGMTVVDRTLIVAESYAHRLTAFDITDDGLTNRRTWAELDDHAAPDGISADNGTVWYADVPNQACVQVAEGGEVLSSTALDRGAFDCVVTGTTIYVATATWRGMSELVAPGSGQVVGIPRNNVRSAGASIRSTGRNVTLERT
ncbi:SMP-30/gluconolactonase/LRE family protein [Actinophytocola sp. NPDC049390]|uniref:SMP-30/gluconolactonase/LRE family protein n=1 Tax=Actinophytocola sp. NPDC049390 TaxID=3363894 RepID=UPI0037A03421